MNTEKLIEELEDDIKIIHMRGKLEGKRILPYVIYESAYWKEPREVCVVDEINCLDNEDAEIICGINNKRTERWIYSLADYYGFTLTKEEKEDTLGKFHKFVITRGKRK